MLLAASRLLGRRAGSGSLGKAAEEQKNGDGQRDQAHEPQLESQRTTSGIEVPGLLSAILPGTRPRVCPAILAAFCSGIPYLIRPSRPFGDAGRWTPPGR